MALPIPREVRGLALLPSPPRNADDHVAVALAGAAHRCRGPTGSVEFAWCRVDLRPLVRGLLVGVGEAWVWRDNGPLRDNGRLPGRDHGGPPPRCHGAVGGTGQGDEAAGVEFTNDDQPGVRLRKGT
jgi:hypothetical protein